MTQRSSTPAGRGKRIAPKQRVLKKRPCAGAQLSAMHGWQIADYAWGQHDPQIIARSSHSEARAWANAARLLYRKRK